MSVRYLDHKVDGSVRSSISSLVPDIPSKVDSGTPAYDMIVVQLLELMIFVDCHLQGQFIKKSVVGVICFVSMILVLTFIHGFILRGIQNASVIGASMGFSTQRSVACLIFLQKLSLRGFFILRFPFIFSLWRPSQLQVRTNWSRVSVRLFNSSLMHSAFDQTSSEVLKNILKFRKCSCLTWPLVVFEGFWESRVATKVSKQTKYYSWMNK